MTSVLLHTNTYKGWKLNEDGTYSLSTMEENKHINAIDTSEVSLMGETLGGVIIDNGVPIYYGPSGEISPPKLVTGLAAELFPGTIYTESTFPSNMQTIRTYTQVTESGTGIPVGERCSGDSRDIFIY